MRSAPAASQRPLALGLVLLHLAQLAACTGPLLAPRAGRADFDLAMIPVPGGWVHPGGGNLLVRRADLSTDTLLGTREITATYNSASGDWTWSFAMRYDGIAFRDATGLRIDCAGLPDGSVAPGTHWLKVDADTLRTKGGLRYEFDGAGRLASVSWDSFDHPRLRYRHEPERVWIDQCTSPGVCTGVFTIELADGLPRRVTEVRTGRVAEYEHVDGLLTKARSAFETEAGLPGTTYEYDGTLLTASTRSEGERVEYDWQPGRRIERVVQIGEGDPTHRFAHHTVDHPGRGLYRTLYTNPLGGRVMFYFDSDRRLHEIRWLDSGDSRQLTWLGRRLRSDRLPGGATTEYEYAAGGADPIRVTSPSGNVVEIAYAPGALNPQDFTAPAVRRVEDSLGPVLEVDYDGQGRPISRRNGAGEAEATSYGFAVFPDAVTSPAGITTTFPRYGVHGHWIETGGPLAQRRGFDPVGNAEVRSRNRRAAGRIRRTFGADRLPAAWAVAGGPAQAVETLRVTRRSSGAPSTLERPGGGDHRFRYDALGRPVARSERVDGVWRETRYEYDPAGNLLAFALPNGTRQEFAYDLYGRLTAHRSLRDGILEGERLLTYRHGAVETSWDSVRGATEVYGYDAAGRIDAISYGRGDRLSRVFDARSRIVAETWAVGSQVLADLGYAYDPADRLVALSDRSTGEPVLEIEYAAGRPTALRYANGLTRTQLFDPTTGLLVGAELRDEAGVRVAATTITRSTLASPARFRVGISVETPLAVTEEEYELDRADRLGDPGPRLLHWRNDAGEERAFAYDALGNRLGTGADAFTYNDEGNRLESASLAGATVDYAYDEAGYATHRGGVPIAWSATGRLTAYGPDRAVWDMSGRLVELEVAGRLRRFDLFGGAVQSDAEAGTVGSLDLHHAVIDLASGERRFRHFDFRRNVSYVTDDDGAVLAHYRYRPYGLDAVHGEHQGTDFVGKTSVGPLRLLGARVYDSDVGRFLSPDPLLQVVNQYAYTSGNPVAFMDASGLVEAETVIAVFTVVIAVSLFVAALPVSATVTVAGITVAQLATGAALSAGVAAAASGLGAIVADGLFPADGAPGEGSGGGAGGGAGPESPAPAPGGTPGGPVYLKTLELGYGGLPPQPSCSPRRLSETPRGAHWLPWLLVANALLGWAVLRARRPARRGRGERARGAAPTESGGPE